MGRFHTSDPLLELYYAWTPYNYVGNNPVRRTDPTGMKWADSTAANNLSTYAQNRIDQLERQNSRLEKRINRRLQKGKSVSNLRSRQNHNDELIKELDEAIVQIGEMGEDQNHTFEFAQVSGEGEHGVRLGSNGNIIIEYSSIATKLHETRHGHQYMTDKGNNWRWNSNNYLAPTTTTDGLINWANAELSAYRLQYAYSPSSMPDNSQGSPNSIYDVTYNWISTIRGTGKRPFPYHQVGLAGQVINNLYWMNYRNYRKKFIETL